MPVIPMIIDGSSAVKSCPTDHHNQQQTTISLDTHSHLEAKTLTERMLRLFLYLSAIMPEERDKLTSTSQHPHLRIHLLTRFHPR